MIKKKIEEKNNIISFPSKLSSIEKEIEAVIFAAAEPLDKDTIESKISKKTNIEKSLQKLFLAFDVISGLSNRTTSNLFINSTGISQNKFLREVVLAYIYIFQ